MRFVGIMTICLLLVFPLLFSRNLRAWPTGKNMITLVSDTGRNGSFSHYFIIGFLAPPLSKSHVLVQLAPHVVNQGFLWGEGGNLPCCSNIWVNHTLYTNKKATDASLPSHEMKSSGDSKYHSIHGYGWHTLLASYGNLIKRVQRCISVEHFIEWTLVEVCLQQHTGNDV